MTFAMFDSTEASQLPSNAPAVAYYADSQFANLAACLRQAPHAKVLPILAQAGEIPPLKELVGWQRGVEIDVENTDWTPAESPRFVEACLKAGVPPRIYCSLSVVPQVTGALMAAGIARDRYKIRSANWTGQAHIDPGVEATQWTDHFNGRNCDASLCEDSYFASQPAPPPHHSFTGHGKAYFLGEFDLNTGKWSIGGRKAP